MKTLGLVLACIITLRASPSYSVRDLGTLGGSSAVGFKINDGGLVIGWAETIWGYQQAFRSTAGAPLQALPSLSPADSYALGVSNTGLIAGAAYVNGDPHGVIWNGNSVTDLGPGVFLTGINNSGAVIGSNGHAFVLAGGVYQDLGVLSGGDWSSASGINAAGTVVGDSNLADGSFRGFVWNPQTGMVELGTFGGRNSHATGINKNGVVIGYATLANGYEHAFGASGAGLMDLGTLGGSSFAYGINDAGLIVGYSWPSSGDHTHAFLFMNGVMFDLNALIPASSGWELLAAYGINSDGQIVGEGLFHNQPHAFLLDAAQIRAATLTNIPEPGARSLVILGFSVILVVWGWRSLSGRPAAKSAAKRPAERSL